MKKRKTKLVSVEGTIEPSPYLIKAYATALVNLYEAHSKMSYYACQDVLPDEIKQFITESIAACSKAKENIENAKSTDILHKTLDSFVTNKSMNKLLREVMPLVRTIANINLDAQLGEEE